MRGAWNGCESAGGLVGQGATGGHASRARGVTSTSTLVREDERTREVEQVPLRDNAVRHRERDGADQTAHDLDARKAKHQRLVELLTTRCRDNQHGRLPVDAG